MISLKNVNKIFKIKNQEVRAVNDVGLTIKPGEIFGIIGYSGAGKSTLIRLLNGLEKPTSGEVIVNNQPISKISNKQLRQSRQEISMIFQHFNLLWSRTVLENIEFPLELAKVKKEERVKRAKELIQLVGLQGKEDAYPSQLSGGQKQRVGIARALANNPKVLLCDEATSALDPETTDQILDLLVDINEKLGLTIVLITHEMHVIQKICHQVAVMEAGKIVETGLVLDVFKNPQAAITKKFVQQLSITEDTEDWIATLRGTQFNQIIQLKFVGQSAEQPLITNLIRNFDITINILQGKVTPSTKGAYGTLTIALDGEPEEINRAITFIESQQVGIEVIN